MNSSSEEERRGYAIVYCEGAFGTTNGKTAHGLVRRSGRYRVLGVVDSAHEGEDAGEVLDGAPAGIPIFASVEDAFEASRAAGSRATHLVIGLAPDGGRLPETAREAVARAIKLGLDVECGLHDFLADDPHLADLASRHGVSLWDIRRPPPRGNLHFFSGKIEEVTALRVAMLGTDSAVGKRTTAWMMVDALTASGNRAELIGTGQTAWLQGASYGVVLDSLVNDFVSGELEHATWLAWKETGARVLVIEGQGSLLNPAYPGGFEILAACRPHCVVLQHAPTRQEYDGFPGYAIQPLSRQIHAVQIISECPVAAITINHEGLTPDEARAACRRISESTGLPVVAPLLDPLGPVVSAILEHGEAHR